ncbi:hypothetical protein MANES_06G087901v8, partial [Manihot esculenta]
MNWLQRKSGSQMKQDQDSIYTGFTTAVAAAVYAIHSLEQAETLKNKNGNKKEDATAKLRFSFKKRKMEILIQLNHATDETSMKRKQNHEALERTYSNRKPSPSPSHKPKIHEDNPGKADRIQNDKLKTLLAWAKAKKMKVKHKMEKKK